MLGVIFKELPTEFADGLDVWCEIPRGGKGGSTTVGLNHWKDGVTLYRYWENERGACWEENPEFDSRNVNLNMPNRYPSGDVSRQLAMQFWNSGDRSRPEIQFGSC